MQPKFVPTFLALLLCSTAIQAQTRTLKFPRGKTSTTVSGKASGDVVYSFRARTGQRATIFLEGAFRFSVFQPDSECGGSVCYLVLDTKQWSGKLIEGNNPDMVNEPITYSISIRPSARALRQLPYTLSVKIE